MCRSILFGFFWLAAIAGTASAESPRLVLDSGGHTSQISDLIFTRDGKYLLSTGFDKVIRIWDLEAGKTVRTIRGWIGDGVEGRIYAAALSPDSKYLAIGGWMANPRTVPTRGGHTYDFAETNAIRIFDFQTGELLKTLKGGDSIVRELAFSPDGNYLISGYADGDISVWVISPGEMKLLRRFNKHKRAIKHIEVSPDGKLVASVAEDDSLKLWNMETALLLRSIGRQSCLAFSPDGSYLVSGSDDHRILMWDAKSGDFKREVYHLNSEITSVLFSSDSKNIIAVTGSTCSMISTDSGKVIADFKGQNGLIGAAAISPVATILATAGGDDNQILVWSCENGEILRSFVGKGTTIWATGFAKDNRSIAYGTGHNSDAINDRGPLQEIVRLGREDSYAVTLGGLVKKENEFVRSIERLDDLKLKTRAPSPSNTIQVVRNGQVDSEIRTDSLLSCYTFTPNGRMIILGTQTGDLMVYKTEKSKFSFLTERRLYHLHGHTDSVTAVAVSPDGRTLVSTSVDQTLKIWDIESGANLLSIFVGSDNEWVAWTAEGYYTSSLNGDQYIGWHVNHSSDSTADYYPAIQFQKQYYRPDIVSEYLKLRDIKMAIRQADAVIDRPSDVIDTGPSAASPNVDITTIVPPVVYVAFPEKDEITVDRGILTVKAVAIAAPNTPPVSEIKVLLNGTQVASVKGGQKELQLEIQIPLQPGANILSIIARSEKAQSDPKIRKVNYLGRNQEDIKPNLRVLAIGISKYQQPSFELKFADKDAEVLAALLKEQQGRLFNEVKIKSILNDDATRNRILAGLDWLTDPNEAQSGDVVVLFLSGHGGLNRGNYYFYGYNHNAEVNPEIDDVKWSTLLDNLTSLRGTKPILFIDTCRSGAAVGGTRYRSDKGLTQALKDLKNNYQGVVFLAASSDDEPSMETERLGHGVFTYALIEGLRGKADVLTKDRIIYINELGNWVREQVKMLTDNQQHTIYNEPSGFKPFPIFALPQ